MSHLLLFGIGRLQDMLDKGNVWYVRSYEEGFDEVTVAYLVGESKTLRQGKTSLISLGTGRTRDFLFAPWTLYKLAKKIGPSFYLTGDQWYSWWTGCLCRMLLGAKIVLIPVSIPHQLYEDRHVTVTGWPKWLDDVLQWLSYLNAKAIWTSPAFGNFVEWLSSDPRSKRKLIVTKTLVEALPAKAFLEQVQSSPSTRVSIERKKFRLVFVGRLHPEKLVDHLIRMMRELPGDEFELIIIGDGAFRQKLEMLAVDLGVDANVHFLGFVSNESLVPLLREADAFVSTMTGSSLREAALIGLPIVAYDRDWVHGLLVHGETALLCPSNHIDCLATQALRLRADPALVLRLSKNVQQLAYDLWTTKELRTSLLNLTGSELLKDRFS